MEELIKLLTTGGWVAFAGFGSYLAYKLAVATIISVTVVKVFGKLIVYLQAGREFDKNMEQVIAAAGMRQPLTSDEWADLRARVQRGST